LRLNSASGYGISQTSREEHILLRENAADITGRQYCSGKKLADVDLSVASDLVPFDMMWLIHDPNAEK
jgi:hypothetical protein